MTKFFRIGAEASLGLALLSCAAALSPTAAVAQQLSAPPFLSRGRGFDEQGGAALYAHVCAACHQPDGKGAVGAGSYPALAGNKNLGSADYIESVLFNGLRGMPALGRMMSDEQVADVTNYVRSRFAQSDGDPLAAADVQAARPK